MRGIGVLARLPLTVLPQAPPPVGGAISGIPCGRSGGGGYRWRLGRSGS